MFSNLEGFSEGWKIFTEHFRGIYSSTFLYASYIYFHGSIACDLFRFPQLWVHFFLFEIFGAAQVDFSSHEFCGGVAKIQFSTWKKFLFSTASRNISYGFCPAYVYVISNENFSSLKGLLQNEVKYVHFFIFEYNDKSVFKSNSSVRYFQDLRRVIET